MPRSTFSQKENTMRMRPVAAFFLSLAMATSAGSAASAEPAGHVTGIGGVFFKAKDPKTLAAWYRDVLGLPLQPWGGAMLRYDAPQHPQVATWRAFPAATTYFAPSDSGFMINYAVDDMDALLARLPRKASRSSNAATTTQAAALHGSSIRKITKSSYGNRSAPHRPDPVRFHCTPPETSIRISAACRATAAIALFVYSLITCRNLQTGSVFIAFSVFQHLESPIMNIVKAAS
jgi:catechol 2,3-dioxygenase-like lactoylglutathione lyase family enzyme